MPKLRLSCFLIACVGAGLLAACDTEGGDAVQAEPTSQEPALTGTLDRSFAGEAVPEVTVTTPDGDTMLLTDIGEPVLINLWATWCAPCIVEMPLLDELAADLDDQVEVMTISEDLRGAEVVVPFFEENTLPNLPQWMDQENELAFSFGGGAVLPLTILYDAEGREVWRVIGAYDWSSATAREEVLEVLGVASSAE